MFGDLVRLILLVFSGGRWLVPIGSTGFGLYLWRRNYDETKSIGGGHRLVISPWELIVFKSLPFNWLSRGVGRLTEVQIPVSLRSPVYGLYSFAFGVDRTELVGRFEDYPTLCSFFTRPLKNGCRPIASTPMVSPADGSLSHCGRISSFQMEQVKNVTYSLKQFLSEEESPRKTFQVVNETTSESRTSLTRVPEDEEWVKYKRQLLHDPTNDLYHCVIYLAPGDYHRFHSPVDFEVKRRKHFNGQLFSVNPAITRYIPGLFVLNERVLYSGTWRHGYFSLTAVGATNVGSIVIYDDPSLVTNARTPGAEKSVNFNWSKGDEIGQFRFGSTIVLVFEAPKGFRFTRECSTRLKTGSPLGTC